MSVKTLIQAINSAVPNARAVSASDFYCDDSGKTGIWIRGSEDYCAEGKRIFNYYDMDNMLHSDIQQLVDAAGYYAEPYDSGTCMVWPV